MSATADVSLISKEKFPRVTDRVSSDHPAFNVPLADAFALLQYLRDERSFDFLVDVTAIDWAAGTSPRFTVVYHLFSTVHHGYVRVAANCENDGEPTAPSIV